MSKVNRGINPDEWRGIFVIAEQRSGQIQPISIEMLGEAKKLAGKLKDNVTVIVLGDDMDESLNDLCGYGADKIIYCKHAKLKTYTTDAYTKVLADLIAERKPEIVIVGATAIGRDLAPRLAARVGTGLTADCTGLDIGEERMALMTRPAFGGNLMATIVCKENRPQMATVRPGVMEKAAHTDTVCKVETIQPEISDADIIAKVTDVVLQKRERPPLSEADIIVAGGRGVKNSEGFELLQSLADKLGGVVGSSRAPVDSGWISPDAQIGQTGTTVRPKLYIACGISGAIQHLAGMSESQTIVAINKDPNAPIHKVAHYSIVGDLFKIIPALIQSIEEKEPK